MNGDGTPDPGFGSTPGNPGRITTPFGSDASGYGMALDAAGRIVVVGSVDLSPGPFAIARYNADGSLDSTFSDDGKVTTVIGPGAVPYGVVIDPQGRLVVAGTAFPGGGQHDIAVARHQPNGPLDTSFSDDGITTEPNGEGSAVVLDANDRIIVAGALDNGPFGLAGFIGDGIAPTATIEVGPVDGSFINDSTPTFESPPASPAAPLPAGSTAPPVAALHRSRRVQPSAMACTPSGLPPPTAPATPPRS